MLTNAPVVDHLAVVAPLHNFRRQVVQCAAHGLTGRGGRVHGPTEIGQFEVAGYVQQQVFGLDVAMDDTVLVAVVQSVRRLVDIFRRSKQKKKLQFTRGGMVMVLYLQSFIKMPVAIALEVFIQLSLARILKDKIDAVVVVEPSEHLQYIGMSANEYSAWFHWLIINFIRFLNI